MVVRQVRCARDGCPRPAFVCFECDYAPVPCSPECEALRKAAKRRESQRKYRRSPHGQKTTRIRVARWRAARKRSAGVTHTPTPRAAPRESVTALKPPVLTAPTATPLKEEPADEPRDQPTQPPLPDVARLLVRCCRCGQLGRLVGPGLAWTTHELPLARANRADAERLADALAPLGLTTRQVGALHLAYVGGSAKTRELVLADPALVLRVHQKQGDRKPTPAEQLLGDVDILGAVARRAHGRLRHGGADGLLPPERDEIYRRFCQARTDVESLARRCEKELHDARPEHPSRDSASA